MSATLEHKPGIHTPEESLASFRTKYDLPEKTTPYSAGLELQFAFSVAIAREDDALEKRRGKLGLIVIAPENVARFFESTPLPDARAGAAVFYQAYVDYCTKRQIDPLYTLVENQFDRPEEMLEYCSFWYNTLSALEKQQAKRN